MSHRFTIPTFTTEAEEAQWWFDHQDELANAFEAAASEGELKTRSAMQLVRESFSAAAVRLDPQDITLAHDLANKRGMPYQTYLETLLHEALAEDEKRLAG